MAARPLAREADLVVEELGEELLVFDRQRQRAHSLNPVAASVWRACNGARTPEQIAEYCGLDRDAVGLALEALADIELLQAPLHSRRGRVAAGLAPSDAASGGADRGGYRHRATGDPLINAPTARAASSTCARSRARVRVARTRRAVTALHASTVSAATILVAPAPVTRRAAAPPYATRAPFAGRPAHHRLAAQRLPAAGAAHLPPDLLGQLLFPLSRAGVQCEKERET